MTRVKNKAEEDTKKSSDNINKELFRGNIFMVDVQKGQRFEATEDNTAVSEVETGE